MALVNIKKERFKDNTYEKKREKWKETKNKRNNWIIHAV